MSKHDRDRERDRERDRDRDRDRDREHDRYGKGYEIFKEILNKNFKIKIQKIIFKYF